MAEQTVKLKLDTSEFDRGLARVNSGFGNLAATITAAAAAFGGFAVARGFLQTARSIENLKFQLKALTGSTAEASKAMDILSKFAGTVPFSLQDIQQAAPSLLAVAKNTDELNKLLAITGDIAAASGLDFQTTALQIQRTFSGGIGAADLFRDRAVKSMLGFQEGVQYTAQQSRDLIIKAFDEGTVSIAGASADMANTFDGSLSMIGDKFFNFQRLLMDSGPFDVLKAAVKSLDDVLTQNFGSLEQMAEKVGQAIVQATGDVLLFGARVLDGMQPVFNFIGNAIANIVNMVEGLPGYIKALGVIGFLALGVKGKLIVVAIAAVVDEVMQVFAHLTNFLATMKEKIAPVIRFLGGEEWANELETNAKSLRNEADSLMKKYGDMVQVGDEFSESLDNNKIVFENLNITIDKSTGAIGANEAAVLKYLQTLDKQIKKQKELAAVTADDGFGQASTSKVTTATGLDEKAQKELAKQREKIEARFKQLQEGLMSETQAEEYAYRNQLKLLQDYYGEHFRHVTEYHKVREALEQRHQQKLAEIGKQQVQKQLDIFTQGKYGELDIADLTEKQKIEFLKGAGKETLRALGEHNRAAFQASKALAMAEAVVNVAKGVTVALGYGPILGPLLAGLIVAAGAAQIATIRNQKYQGRATGGLVQGNTPYVVGEKGPELMVPNRTGTIVPNNQLMGGKNVNVTFNINALDARGVDELIVERKGLITSIIRDAAYEKGERIAI